MNRFPDDLLPWDVPEVIRRNLTLQSLRPWALRAVWQILNDNSATPAERLKAAQLVERLSKNPEQERGLTECQL